MVSFLPSSFLAYVSAGLASLLVMTLSYQLQPASSKNLKLLFWDWFTHFRQKLCNLCDTGPVSLPSSVIAGHSYDVYACKQLFEQINVTPSSTKKVHPSMSQTCGDSQFSLRLFGFFWQISFDFLMIPKTEEMRLRCGLKIDPYVCFQLTPMWLVNLLVAFEAMTSSSNFPQVVRKQSFLRRSR